MDRISIYDTPADPMIPADDSMSYASASSTSFAASSHRYVQVSSLPATPRYTSSAMLAGHTQSTKRNVCRNFSSCVATIEGNLFYSAGSAGNASANGMLGASQATYGLASSMPVAFPINVEPVLDSPPVDLMTSGATASASVAAVGSSSSSAGAVPVTAVPPTSSHIVFNATNQLYFCLPPTLPTQRTPLPISFQGRQKEIVSSHDPESDNTTEIMNQNKIHGVAANLTDSGMLFIWLFACV